MNALLVVQVVAGVLGAVAVLALAHHLGRAAAPGLAQLLESVMPLVAQVALALRRVIRRGRR
jgi:hypothetical protein